MKTALLATAAFANPAATPQTPATGATAGKAGAPKVEDRVAPIFTEIATDIPMPTKAKSGAKSELAKKLAELPVGGSIGIANKTKKQISSTISKTNNDKDNQRPKLDANGAPVTKTGEPVKDATGVIISYGPAVAVTERVKEFEAFDVDPKDPKQKGASVRIFRVK